MAPRANSTLLKKKKSKKYTSLPLGMPSSQGLWLHGRHLSCSWGTDKGWEVGIYLLISAVQMLSMISRETKSLRWCWPLQGHRCHSAHRGRSPGPIKAQVFAARCAWVAVAVALCWRECFLNPCLVLLRILLPSRWMRMYVIKAVHVLARHYSKLPVGHRT